MKTKHLFFATALVASFASCTNDDIVEMQQAANAERPTVDNVQLNFVAEGVDSRLTFGSKGYAWEADDVIGALNMDKPLAKTGEWSEKYDFTDYINTSYPFTYNTEDGTWGTQGKMLEGNYFFAFPFTDYEGERYANYSLINQQQNGIKGAVVAENYAKNQVFVGYSPIMKGSGFDVLTDVEMTPLLGAIRLDIVNAGEKTYHINKIVVQGATENYEVESLLNIDPTKANYGAYNVGATTADATANTKFNYANYIGKNIGKDDVYNIPEEDEKYNRADALRAVANYGGDNSQNFVQLFINGTESERAIAPKGTAYALIMVNPIEFCVKNPTTGKYGDTASGELKLTIYTDEGIVETVSLLAKSETGVKTNGKVQATLPGIANTIKVTFDDTTFAESDKLNIYTEADLLQLVNWNAAAKVETPITATLKADVKLTKETYELLAANKNIELTINSSTFGTEGEITENTEVLTLAADVPATALENEGLIITSPVSVEGEIALGIKAQDLASITVLKDAVLNINVLNANVPAVVTVEEGGKLNIGAAAKTSSTVKIVNNGIMNVAAGALVQGLVENNAEMNLNGTANNVVNTKTLNMGATSKLIGGSNGGKDAIINTVSGATLSNITKIEGEDNGEVKYVDGAVIVYKDGASTVASDVYVEVLDGTTVDANKYDKKGVTLWKFKGNVEVTHCVSLPTVQIEEGATVELTVKADSTLTMTTLTVLEGGAISTNGKFAIGTIKVEEDAELTNNGEIAVSTEINNLGLIYNNGEIKCTTDLLATNKLTGVVVKDVEGSEAANGKYWKNNPFMNYDSTLDTLKKTAMENAVKEWMKKWYTNATTGNRKQYYNGNPYDYVAFLKSVNLNSETWNPIREALKTYVVGDKDAENAENPDDIALFTADELNPKKTTSNTVFTTVVGELLTAEMQSTIKAHWIDTTTGSATNGQFKADAVDELEKSSLICNDAAGVNKLVAKILTLAYTTNSNNAKTAAAIWDELTAVGTAISTTDVADDGVADLKYHFITKTDTIYKAVVAWATHSSRITNDATNFIVSSVTGSVYTAGPKFASTDANDELNTVDALKAYVNYLTNLGTMTKAQQSAYDAIDEYIEYILALPAVSFDAAQLNACWIHSQGGVPAEAVMGF